MDATSLSAASSSTTVIPALVLGVAGFGVLVYILFVFYRSLTGQVNLAEGTKGLGDKMALKRREAALAQADALIKAGSFHEAVEILRKTFLLDHVKSSPGLVDSSVNLHLSVLSRLIMIAERKGAHLENLPVVEDLVQGRGQLLHSYLDTIRDRGALKQKRSKSGKGVADWALSEFDKKLSDLEDRIATNKRSLETQIDTLFAALDKLADSSQVTYH